MHDRNGVKFSVGDWVYVFSVVSIFGILPKKVKFIGKDNGTGAAYCNLYEIKDENYIWYSQSLVKLTPDDLFIYQLSI
jgi:hypothetical protein